MNGRAWWVVAVVVSGCGVVRDPRSIDLCEFSQPADFAFAGTVTWAGFGPVVSGRGFDVVSATVDRTLWGTVPSTTLLMATACSDLQGKPGSIFTSIDFHGMQTILCFERKTVADIEYLETGQVWPASTFESDLVASRTAVCIQPAALAAGDAGVPDAGP